MSYLAYVHNSLVRARYYMLWWDSAMGVKALLHGVVRLWSADSRRFRSKNVSDWLLCPGYSLKARRMV